MNYRRLGRSGLQVSELSIGSWVTYGNQVDHRAARESLAAARDAGINFFDNAEVYAKGQSEEIMGEALKALGWSRVSYVVSTKFFWGLAEAPNQYHTLNRKYLMDAIDGSLRRLQLDYVDLVFCHRPDPNTPIEETVWAMSDMIARGKALYWGTSEWSADEIRAAYEIAERHHLHKPVMEQPQYNLFSSPPRRTGIPSALRGHWPGPDYLEPAGLGAADRKVSRRRTGREPGRGARL